MFIFALIVTGYFAAAMLYMGLSAYEGKKMKPSIWNVQWREYTMDKKLAWLCRLWFTPFGLLCLWVFVDILAKGR